MRVGNKKLKEREDMAYDSRHDHRRLVNWPALAVVIILVAVVAFIVYRTY